MTPYVYIAKVVKWVDGDTVDLDVDLGFKTRRIERFRLIGIDTPERGKPGFKEAKELAESIYPIGSEIMIESMRTEKYGRWLVDIAPVRKALLSANLAELTKEKWRGKNETSSDSF